MMIIWNDGKRQKEYDRKQRVLEGGYVKNKEIEALTKLRASCAAILYVDVKLQRHVTYKKIVSATLFLNKSENQLCILDFCCTSKLRLEVTYGKNMFNLL